MQETKVCFFCLLHNSTFIFWSFSLPVSCFHSLSIVGFVNFEAWWQHWFWQFISVLITAKQKEPTTFKIRKWSMVGFPFFFFFFSLELLAANSILMGTSRSRMSPFLLWRVQIPNWTLYYAWFSSSNLYQYFLSIWKFALIIFVSKVRKTNIGLTSKIINNNISVRNILHLFHLMLCLW